MFRKFFTLTAAFGIVGLSLLPADAQSFRTSSRAVSRIQTTAPKSSFDSNFEKFNQDLGATGNRMAADRAMIESSVSANQTAQSNAIQADTGVNSQRAFNNSQAQALNSGGLYNTPVRTNNTWLFSDPVYYYHY